METLPEPRLAPPGAGLPKVELFLGGLLFRVRQALASRDTVRQRLDLEQERIRGLVAEVSPENGARRVLIPRLPGLEDSSRYWSVWMTVDHLRIVNTSMARVIRALGRDVVPPGQASTAAVKPQPGVGPEVLEGFHQSCDLLRSTVDAVPELKTRERFAHPWFGPLDAHGWHVLSAGHLALHRRQLEQILARLPSPGF